MQGIIKAGLADVVALLKRRSLAMDPAAASANVAPFDPVVANVDNARALRFQSLQCSACDQFAIRRSPSPRVIMSGQVPSGLFTFLRKTAGSKLRRVLAQDRLAESA